MAQANDSGEVRVVGRQRSDWSVGEIASHALQATSISQLTLPEVKKLAARVLRDYGDRPESNATDLESAQIAAAERLDASDRR